LSYAAHLLSQFMQNPKEEHMNVARQVLRYLKATLGHGILLNYDSTLQVHAYCDAD